MKAKLSFSKIKYELTNRRYCNPFLKIHDSALFIENFEPHHVISDGCFCSVITIAIPSVKSSRSKNIIVGNVLDKVPLCIIYFYVGDISALLKVIIDDCKIWLISQWIKYLRFNLNCF